MVWWPFATKPERADTLEVTDLHSVAPPLYSTISLENTRGGGSRSVLVRLLDSSFQHGVLESRLTWMSSEASLRTWVPAIHAGMTTICIFFHILWASVS
jgi:hypothetical protein